MLAFNDSTLTIDEPKSVRMEQRTKLHVKTTIQQAAVLLGVDETAFVTTAAYDRARETIASHERTVLSAKDRKAFLDALDNPPKPTEALVDAIKRHDRVVINDR